MHISYTTLFSSVFMGIPLLYLLAHIQRNLNSKQLFSSRTLNIIILVFMFKLIVPFEFPYTISLPSFHVLTTLRDIMLTTIPDSNITIGNILCSIWITGSVIKLIKLIKDYHFFVHKIKDIPNIANYIKPSPEVPMGISIKQVDFISSPCVMGVFKPTILLPNQLFTKKELYYILNHELMHINRFDILLKQLFELLTIIYWWNPLVYAFREQMSQIIEMRVDDLVIENLDKYEKLFYAELLLKLSSSQNTYVLNPALSVGFASFDSCPLIQRTENILVSKNKKLSTIKVISLSTILLFVMTLFTFEPYYLDQPGTEGTVEIHRFNSYLVPNEEGNYDLYVDEQFFGDVTDLNADPNIKDLPIRKGK